MGLVLGCGGLADSDGKGSAAAPGAATDAASNLARPGSGAPTSPLVSIPRGGPPSQSAAPGLATTGPVSTFPATSAAPPSYCTTPPDPNTSELLKDQGENIVSAYCGSCHGAQLDDEGAGGVSYINDFARLSAQGLLVPCDPERSPIIQVMRSGAMPPPSSGLPPACPWEIDLVVAELAFFCAPPGADAGSSGVADAGSASSDAGP
jgi:mono/diheme cytochrome c family protein